MKKLTTLFGIAGITFVASAGFAIELTPGEWTFTTISENSMMPGKQRSEKVKCVTAEEAKADPLKAFIDEGDCTVLSRKESGNTLEFEVECKGDPKMRMTTRGKGTFTSKGKTASGKMQVKMSAPNMPNMPEMPNMPKIDGMTMTQTWEGKYNGPCK